MHASGQTGFGEEEDAGPAAEFISVQVTPGAKPVFGEERVLFAKDLHHGGFTQRFYEVSPDARSILVPGPDRSTASSRIHVVASWVREFAGRIP